MTFDAKEIRAFESVTLLFCFQNLRLRVGCDAVLIDLGSDLVNFGPGSLASDSVCRAVYQTSIEIKRVRRVQDRGRGWKL